MSAERIESPRNRRVGRVRRLGQRKYRQRENLFRVEGLQAIHMGLAAGVEPVELFYCEELFAGEGAPSLLERCGRTNAELVPVAVQVMESLSGRDAPQGLIALFPHVARPLGEIEVGEGKLVLVLDRLQNAGNLGTLLRTADAAGVGAVVLLEPCVDLYDPTAVRSSMGSIFNLPLARAVDSQTLMSWVKGQGLRVVGADPYEGTIWHRADWRGGGALVLGNEARGLSDDVRTGIEEWVRLPMRGKAESLNVAVTGGVLIYAWVQGNEEES